MASPTPLTRRELYDLVWSKPMMRVAEQFGITGTGLAKICKRSAIPIPPRGYWAKLQHGKKVKQDPFLELGDPRREKLVIQAGAWRLPDEVREVIRHAKERQAERSPPALIAPPPKEVAAVPLWPVAEVHPLLRATAQALRKGKPDPEGALHASADGMAGVVVGRESVERAIYVLDALVRSLVERGLPPKPVGKGLLIERGPDSATISLTERTRREKHVPTPEDLAAEERRKKKLERHFATRNPWQAADTSDLFQKAYPDFDTVRTGELALQITGWNDCVRRTWADGRIQRLERLVEDVATGIEAILTARRLQREEREERERQYQERARRHALAQLRREREDKRLAFLKTLIKLQREVDALEAWLSRQPPAGGPEADENARLREWAASRLDALRLRLTPEGIGAAIDAADLFPDPDDLHDPLGDPKEKLGWY